MAKKRMISLKNLRYSANLFTVLPIIKATKITDIETIYLSRTRGELTFISYFCCLIYSGDSQIVAMNINKQIMMIETVVANRANVFFAL